MKILMLSYEFPPIGGGGGQALLNILNKFIQYRDIEIDVLTCGAGHGLAKEEFSDRIHVYKVGINKAELHYWKKIEVISWLRKARKIYKHLIRVNQYDLAHAFFAFPSGWLCYRSARYLPYIISLRGSDVPGANPRLWLDYKLMAPIFHRIWKNASALVACSNGLRERALRFMPSVNIDVIPNGVDVAKFNPGVKFPKNNPRKLLTVGRLSASKRVDLLIECVDILRRSFTDISLSIVGDGSLRNDLEKMVRGKRLNNNVVFLGRVVSDEIPVIYREHDLYVSASYQEGMSNAMLEAMASGLPLVTTPCEGVEELVTNNGLIVKDTQPDEFARIISDLIAKPDICQKMSKYAYEHAKKFTWNGVVEQYYRCYQKIVDRKYDNCL